MQASKTSDNRGGYSFPLKKTRFVEKWEWLIMHFGLKTGGGGGFGREKRREKRNKKVENKEKTVGSASDMKTGNGEKEATKKNLRWGVSLFWKC